ncbi:uncharacterized protein B0H18DRAFT_84077 [Fomitopsis serialis]|uniref:uncharacterized protein n=1 Tax=Fomitopsis serialis TaxID=139415 RepID=UPI002008BFC3|nr:uncharacterized protein B0H18DRAFT_84077 [Neoantrodia serialis]KAH9931441.1 hypothetical protein B0H18DRAFT_84077 [Neoantrodia serialis]
MRNIHQGLRLGNKRRRDSVDVDFFRQSVGRVCFILDDQYPCLQVARTSTCPHAPSSVYFGAPTLKDISITASDIEQPMLLRILEDLPVLCPELERVVIKHPTRRQNCTHITYSPDIFPACNQFFYDMLNGPSGSSTLRHLTTCITLTWDDVFLLAQMPRLETLDATVCAPPEYPEPPLPEGAFQSLIHLKLELFELDDLMDRLLGGIDCPGLESLDVEVTETPPKEPQIRRFFERVALGTFRDGLERLRFEVWWHILPDEWDECVPGISMSMRTLGPLLQLPSLASLSLMVPRICLRYPDDFRELSLAWPQLRKISILQFSNAVSPADVDGLCAFAALSPNLKSIAFDVNGDFIPSPPYYSPEDMPLRSASVRKVTCCVYRQLSQDEVLAYLKFIFPNAVVKPTLESDRRVRRWREWDDE